MDKQLYDNLNLILDEYKALTIQQHAQIEDMFKTIQQLQSFQKTALLAIKEITENAIVTVKEGKAVEYRVLASFIEGLYKAALGEHK